jgi:Flp pilus assembly protein TadG
MRPCTHRGMADRFAPLLARLSRGGRDQRGMAMVEFALILPFMLLLYIGTSAVTLAVSASRATVVLARTLTDITSQQKANVPLTDTTAQNIFAAAAFVMAPFPINTLKMTLSNVEFVANAASTGSNGLDAKTRWTVTFSGGTLRPCLGNPLLTPVANGSAASPATMPLGLYAAGFLIVADVSYVYTPTFGYFNYNFQTGSASTSRILSFTMSRTTYMRPRQTDNIRYTASQTALVCPIASPQSA